MKTMATSKRGLRLLAWVFMVLLLHPTLSDARKPRNSRERRQDYADDDNTEMEYLRKYTDIVSSHSMNPLFKDMDLESLIRGNEASSYSDYVKTDDEEVPDFSVKPSRAPAPKPSYNYRVGPASGPSEGAPSPMMVMGSEGPLGRARMLGAISNDPRCNDETMRALAYCAVGFGSGATGGLKGRRYEITTLEDNNDEGSLRYALTRKRPLWIVFKVSGLISLSSQIPVRSNKTIDGRGAKIEIVRNGFFIGGATNVIVHNIIIRDGKNGDAIAIKYFSNNVWVDSVSFSKCKDGLVDTTRWCDNVTISRSTFSNHNKVALVGVKADLDTDNKPLDDLNAFHHMTFHHNFFNGTTQRHPRVFDGQVHVFNNLYKAWRLYGVGSVFFGQVNTENNIFEAGSAKRATRVFSDPGIPEINGYLRSTGDVTLNDSVIEENEPDFVFDWREYYDATIAAPDDYLKQYLENEIGWQDVPLPPDDKNPDEFENED